MHGPDEPVPPPFMWACRRCAELLDELAIAAILTTKNDLYDGALRCQLLLAGHLAAEHRDGIPSPHEDCPRCAFYEKQPDIQRQHFDDLWAEHRARDLFLPASVARLM
jgi:hypothetical protein